MNIPEKETARVEAFSDGIFGFAMTLLILNLTVPLLTDDALKIKWQLLRSLFALWPSFVAYLLSFGTVLIMWINHHGLFRHARRADNRLLFANGFLLLAVTIVPFPTAVLAKYLDTAQANSAATFYCGWHIIISLGYYVLFTAIEKEHRAMGSATEPILGRIRHAYTLGIVAYITATIVSIFSAYAGLAICFSLWGVWILLGYSPKPASSIEN